MNCPRCGFWNRASFPRCFKCGEILATPEQTRALPEQSGGEDAGEPSFVVQFDEDGNETIQVDPKDRLAFEMQELVRRKQRGEQLQRELRTRGARRGLAPTGSRVTASPRRNRIFSDPAAISRSPFSGPDRDTRAVDYDGYAEIAGPRHAHATMDYSAQLHTGRGYTSSIRPPSSRRMPHARVFRRRRFLPLLAIILAVSAALYALYSFVLDPLFLQKKSVPEEEQVSITASILDDMAAHTIRIPAPEGSRIYVKELRRFYLSTGGYASFQVADHSWYEHEEEVVDESMEVTLTPYLHTSGGELKEMEPIHYAIDIPLSPLTFLSPDAQRFEVSTPIYNIRFHVLQNSSVSINGEDYSSYVNTQNGFITYNASIQPIGDNSFHIVVRSQYYRQNEATIVIYRPVQDIPLDLATTLDDESTLPTMRISATTLAGASVQILSPHESLDLSQLGSTGTFAFDAVFTKIGNNTVIIQADYPGKARTVINYDVYYLPGPGDYTRKAWALNDGFGYPDLLANLNTRIANTQIYVFTGPVLEIISKSPQLAVIDAGDGVGTSLEVMVENRTKTEWKAGERYRLYADAYGMYGRIPRLIARYTYPPAK